jgi:hypothetical protein
MGVGVPLIHSGENASLLKLLVGATVGEEPTETVVGAVFLWVHADFFILSQLILINYNKLI